MRLCGRLTKQRLAFLMTVCLVATLLYIVFPWKRHINVVVVEENREALIYWVKAAKAGVIPHYGNTLVHISAHSGQALPRTVPGLPAVFRPVASVTDSNVLELIQANDDIVQTVVMMGLVSRVIWIFPSWNPNILPNAMSSKREMQLGWVTVSDDADGARQELCSCVVDQTGVPSCRDRNHRDVSADTCNVVSSYTSEYVHEDTTVQWAMDPASIPQGSNVILDLDESFFGCEPGALPLLEEGIEWEVLQKLNNRVEHFVCPWLAQQEQEADTLLSDLVVLFYRTCSWPRESNDYDVCETTVDALHAATQEGIVDVWKARQALFCAKNETSLKLSWREFLSALSHFSKSQVKVLVDIGFCYKRSPRGLSRWEGPGLMKVCHGVLVPDDPSIYQHSPTDMETQQRAAVLELVLHSNSLIQNTRFVTLTRSIREGYTPRGQVDYIEELVHSSLEYSQPQGEIEVTYDRGLLGGAWGWSERYKPNLEDVVDF